MNVLGVGLPDLGYMVVVGVVLIVVFLMLRWATREGREASVDSKLPYVHIGPKPASTSPAPSAPAASAPSPMLGPPVPPPVSADLLHRKALEALTDVVKGLGAVAGADGTTIDAVGRNWFDFLCTSLAIVVSLGDRRVRVAIWTEDETDLQHLNGLAYHGFDKNDPKLQRLVRANTVAGWVLDRKEDHYCPDRTKCTVWRPRQNPNPSYWSMYAAPLGAAADPWGVITVDVDILDGIDQDRRELVRWFGEVATTGATMVGTSGVRRTSIAGS